MCFKRFEIIARNLTKKKNWKASKRIWLQPPRGMQRPLPHRFTCTRTGIPQSPKEKRWNSNGVSSTFFGDPSIHGDRVSWGGATTSWLFRGCSRVTECAVQTGYRAFGTRVFRKINGLFAWSEQIRDALAGLSSENPLRLLNARFAPDATARKCIWQAHSTLEYLSLVCAQITWRCFASFPLKLDKVSKPPSTRHFKNSAFLILNIGDRVFN